MKRLNVHNKRTSFILSKVEDLSSAVSKAERADQTLSMHGLADINQVFGISFKDKLLILEDGTQEKIDDATCILLRSDRAAYQECARLAKAIDDLCKQGGLQPMSKKESLSRLYDRKSFLYKTATDREKLGKFKKSVRRARIKEEDGEAIVALVKILRKIGY